MRRYQAYLLDLDGTIYRGEEAIPSAVDFVQKLAREQIPYLFVTNNSSQTPEAVVKKLSSLKVPAREEQVMTSSIATAKYIKRQKEQATCFVIGESGLQQALVDEGLSLAEEAVDYVVVGIDREISYEKLATACLLIRQGAGFIATNSDRAIPTERGLVPGNGALASVISVSTGVEPTFIGKPEAIIMEEALQRLGLEKDEVVMVGDNYDTDIQAGIQSGLDTLMVFTGVTPISSYEELPVKPTHYVEDLSEWME